ncbi:Protein kinase domain-containing protein [Mycena kentingensis (nom. inval.)]|nr:Protein kinase domain-containing protein [Mycena kentingensis (nom. inval.)]
MDSLQLGDFDIMKEIASGRRATVYLVNCKRGRLRNRQLALRKVVSPSSVEIERLSESSEVHLSASHPCILALFGTFDAPSAHFQLLELALGGPLSNYVDGHALDEDRSRGIMKGLVDALLHLGNHGIVHRNICPANIFLTADGRPKLGDFELATRSPPSKIPENCFKQSPHFFAPEILSGLSHSFECDLWSLGCVLLACLSGRVPFKGTSADDTTAKILCGSYSCPTEISSDAENLLSMLLKTDPQQRMLLNDVLSHCFFDGPVVPIRVSTCDDLLSKQALFESKSTPPRLRLTRNSLGANQTNIDDMRNTKMRTALRTELLSRRIVSDPLPSKPRLSSYSFPSRISRPDNSASSIASPVKSSARSTLPVGTTRPVAFTTTLLHPETHKTVHGQITILPSKSLLVDFREAERRRGQKGAEVLLLDPQGRKIEIYAAPHLSTPCCLAEPVKSYSIDSLPSAYWKLYNDAALLVERIKQRTPKLILHLGSAQCTLMANSAPADIELLVGHPSTPTNTHTEPASTSAARLRLRLSRHQGSLEVAKHVSGSKGEEWTKRVFRTIKDDSSHICSADWESLDDGEREAMEQLGRFWRLCVFLEEQERQGSGKGTALPLPQSPSRSPSRLSLSSPQRLRTQSSLPALRNSPLRLSKLGRDSPPPMPRARAPSVTSNATTLSNVHVAPRPSKLSFGSLPLRRPSSFSVNNLNRVPFTSGFASNAASHASAKTPFKQPTWCADESTPAPPLAETKYIPSVGWCIRQSSRVTQGGRYKVMFVDGAVLEIDVDEDWAEFTGQDGVAERYNTRHGKTMRPIAERMKVFGEFVSLFEEEEEVESPPQRRVMR